VHLQVGKQAVTVYTSHAYTENEDDQEGEEGQQEVVGGEPEPE